MAISLALTTGALPLVRVTIPGTDLPDGDAWSLTGSTASGFTWTPAGGSGTGADAQVMFLDALAPLNVTLTYSLTVAGSVVDSDTITRTYAPSGGDGRERDVLSSLTGGTFAAVRRAPGDRRYSEHRYHASRVPGSRFSPIRLDPVAGAGGGDMDVRTVGAHTAAIQAIVDANDPMVYLHDTDACEVPGCPIAPAEIIYLVSAESDMVERWDVGQRAWSLRYIRTTHPDPDTILGSTWDEFDAAALTWDALDALALDWDEFDAMDWGSV